MNSGRTPPQSAFLETKEYRRFAEFCDACRQYRYIGLCYGPPGVGKTFSAWQYAQWDLMVTHFPERFYESLRLIHIEGMIARVTEANTSLIVPEMQACRSILYTPAITNTPKLIAQEIRTLRLALSYLVEATHPEPPRDPLLYPTVHDPTELLIVDEAERLKTASLEQIRDIADLQHLGVVLIGMPGLEKRLSRYPQLYSRVGFVHEFKPLHAEEIRQVLQRQWQQWHLPSVSESIAEDDAIAAIIRITTGNFRLLQRLLTQIERIVQINALRMITKEVVEVARRQLVIGTT